MATLVPVKGIKRYRDRHGKWRCYHRKTGKPILSQFGTAAFFQEVEAIEAGLKAREPAPGSLGAVIKAYQATPHFQDLAEATKTGYRRYMNMLADIEALPVSEIDSAFLAELRDGLAVDRGRRQANYVLAMVSILFEFANERGWAKGNRAKQVKRVKRDKAKPKANRPWALSERLAVLDAAPWQIKVPLALAMFTACGSATA